ncbi:MAG: CPBP family intramembrane glutamic endopeptidase [Spirosomataceae bacterium]|jgi:membrane protease YdiL (CAAX protease family)
MFELQEKSERPAISSLFIIIGLVIVGMTLANVLSLIWILAKFPPSTTSLIDMQNSIAQSSKDWWFTVLNLGLASLLTFIVPGIFYWQKIEKKSLSLLNQNNLPVAGVFLLAFVIQLIFAPLNGTIQELNKNMKLPAFLGPVEQFMQEMEQSLAQLTEFLTSFQSPLQLIIALIVIAAIAGIGEELIFRGLIQRKILYASKNPHLAIWLAAFIFSAIHFQFYGFFPRLFLGAMFGYFYFWTGNLWVPIAAHIFNNGLAVVMIFLVNKKVIPAEVEKMDNVPLSLSALSLALFLVSMWYFRNYSRHNSKA